MATPPLKSRMSNEAPSRACTTLSAYTAAYEAPLACKTALANESQQAQRQASKSTCSFLSREHSMAAEPPPLHHLECSASHLADGHALVPPARVHSIQSLIGVASPQRDSVLALETPTKFPPSALEPLAVVSNLRRDQM